MARIITRIVFDLKFDILTVPPAVVITFTDVVNGREEQATASMHDDEAASIWHSIAKGMPMLEAVNAALDAAAKKVQEPGSVAARIAAANEAEHRARVAHEAAAAQAAAAQAAAAEVRRIDAIIAAKLRELAELAARAEQEAKEERQRAKGKAAPSDPPV